MFAHTIEACRRVDTSPFRQGGKALHHAGHGRLHMGKGGMACFGKSTFPAGTMIHGPWCATWAGVDALFRDVLPTTIGASPLGQCHTLPPEDKDMALRRSMTLHCRDVQKKCSWGTAIKRNQCPLCWRV